MHARAQASNRLARAYIASHGPRVRAHRKSKENYGIHAKESPKEPKVRSTVPKAHTSSTSLENSKSEASSDIQESAQTCTTDNSWIHDGWSQDEWNDDWSSHERCEQTKDNSASSLSLGSFDLGAMSSPKRFEWVKMNLDTGAAVNTSIWDLTVVS